jgi:hypothetical protein
VIETRSKPTVPGMGSEFPLVARTGAEDDASAAPAVPEGCTVLSTPRVAPRTDARLRRVAGEILRSVQSRLPGRVRDLTVRIEGDQFVISGVSTSYYVKQVAQHVAMGALDSLMLGRLVNEIEVRTR